MSLTSYRAAPPRGRRFGPGPGRVRRPGFREESGRGFFRFGGDLLSRVLGRSTIGAAALNGRVRDGIGCFARAVATKPGKRTRRRALEGPVAGHAHETGLVHFVDDADPRSGSRFPGKRRSACFRIGSKPVGRLVPVS